MANFKEDVLAVIADRFHPTIYHSRPRIDTIVHWTSRHERHQQLSMSVISPKSCDTSMTMTSSTSSSVVSEAASIDVLSSLWVRLEPPLLRFGLAIQYPTRRMLKDGLTIDLRADDALDQLFKLTANQIWNESLGGKMPMKWGLSLVPVKNRRAATKLSSKW